MSRLLKSSASRRSKHLEAGGEGGGGGPSSSDTDRDDPFDIISTKNASLEALRRWRRAALAINATRRFRYTLDIKKKEEEKEILRKIRAQAQIIKSASLNRAAAEQENGTRMVVPTSPAADFGVGQEQLVQMSREHNIGALRQYGGVAGLSVLLKTDLGEGICGNDADLLERKNAFGSNTYPLKKGKNFWRFLWEACQDVTLILLMIAAIASLLLGIKTKTIKQGWYDEGGIAFAVVLIIVATAISDYRQSLLFENWKEEKRNIRLEVTRGGKRLEVSIYDIVVGDMIPLKIGDQVPADGVLISGHSFGVDESSLTGENQIVFKDSNKNPFLMSGCKVVDGLGTMLVTSVGLNTEWGSLMACILEDNGEETPLQVRLNGVATFVGLVGLTAAFTVFLVLSTRYFTGHTKNTDGSVQFIKGKTKVGHAIDDIIKIFTLAVSIVVVTVPEGLPLAVTLTLAYSMRNMLADKALVRRLSACETMGFATTICCDKTGILTLNQMTVVEAYGGGGRIDPADSSLQLSPQLKSLLVEGIALNTNGSVFLPIGGGGDAEVSGSPTERAILNWGIRLGMDFDAVRAMSSVIHVFPFTSEKKRSGIALRLPESLVRIHWKGAAEIILASCSWYMHMDNTVCMDEDKVRYFKTAIDNMAARSLRCIAIAYQTYEAGDFLSNQEVSNFPMDGLVLLAIIGTQDLCRPGVRNAVQVCQTAGVKVRMVTGDNLQTARAIALECGILGSTAGATDSSVMEGKEFRSLSTLDREKTAEQILVMGRSSPKDKLLLVQALKKRGHVVAVTGNETNDASALHEADIGLAMGIGGTAVAKESSDIIIVDDNFASVVKTIRWGRSLYANIQKYTQFRLTVNAAALIVCVIVAVRSGDFPLNAVQLLWVNLLIDTLGALALATEPPTDDLMQRHPVGRREPLVTKMMLLKLVIQVAYQVTALLVLNFHGKTILQLKSEDLNRANEVKNTLIFNSFVFCQVFNELECRKLNERNIFRGILRNHLFLGTVLLTILLQVIVIEFLGIFTSTVRLDWKQWLISVGIGLFSQLGTRFPFEVYAYARR